MATSKGPQSTKPTRETAVSLPVLKTWKLFIGGQFPRTESGRHYTPMQNGNPLANVCLASRKDLRNAVVAARAAQGSWAARSAYNRGQILYRIAEMLEGRYDQFRTELQLQGLSAAAAKTEVRLAIDRLVYYCGWCDKYQQIFSSVNPVSTDHFNFSVLEPTGVVVVVASENQPLLGLVSLVTPIIAGGNSCVVLASESKPLSSITFCEVLNTSDLPPGVVNVLTGNPAELAEHFAKHMDVNAIAFDRDDPSMLTGIQQRAASNVKRVKSYAIDWTLAESASPWFIHDFSEIKTTWHPIEKISKVGSGY